jgi:hypothetical protein
MTISGVFPLVFSTKYSDMTVGCVILSLAHGNIVRNMNIYIVDQKAGAAIYGKNTLADI